MSSRMNAPLSVQMESLKKSMSSRDKRRNQDRLQRATQASMEQGGREVYDQRAKPVNATGGVSLGPASAAQSAVERAAALGGPRMIRCELCQASFVGGPQYKQHLDSAIHRKALAKEEARRQRELLLGANAGAAESAVAAAAWANGGSMGGRRERAAQPLPARPLAAPLPDGVELAPASQQQQQQPGGTYQHAGSTGVRGQLPTAQQAQPRPQPGHQGRGLRGAGSQGRGRGRGRCYAEEAAAAEAARQAAMLSHADLVASARRDTGPLSIGGWVPPTIVAARSQTDAEPEQAEPYPGEDGETVQVAGTGESDTGAAPAPAEAAYTHTGAENTKEAGKDGVAPLIAYNKAEDSDASEDSDDEDTNRPRIVSFF